MEDQKQESNPVLPEITEEKPSVTEECNAEDDVEVMKSEATNEPQPLDEQEAAPMIEPEAVSEAAEAVSEAAEAEAVEPEATEEERVCSGENAEEEVVVNPLEQPSEPEKQPVISTEEVMTMFDELNRKFDEKIAADSHKNELFDKMYAELGTYKNDIYQKMLKPIIMDVIMLIDDTNKFIRDVYPGDTKKVYKALCMIPDDLLEILERNGVEAFHDESDEFNPKTQRVLKTIPAAKLDMDNRVESRIRHGYKWDGKVIKPEMIHCYKYSQNN